MSEKVVKLLGQHIIDMEEHYEREIHYLLERLNDQLGSEIYVWHVDHYGQRSVKFASAVRKPTIVERVA